MRAGCRALGCRRWSGRAAGGVLGPCDGVGRLVGLGRRHAPVVSLEPPSWLGFVAVYPCASPCFGYFRHIGLFC